MYKQTKKQASPTATNLNRQGSASSLGEATGIDTEACVAAPRRASMPTGTLPKMKSKSNGKTPTKNVGKGKSKAGGGTSNGVKKDEEDLKRQNSNSTCNSSLTSLPGAMDNKNLVIDRGGLVK